LKLHKDFQDISDKTPLLADLKPSGKYLMEDLHEAGGVPAMKYLLKQGLLHGDCLTVTGKTLAENLFVPDLNDGQEVIHEIQSIKSNRKYSNLIRKPCRRRLCCKISGNEGEYFEGDAIVYENEHDVITGVRGGEVKPGNVVIRYCGP
jgi:dihydroxy-acid dehydratase